MQKHDNSYIHRRGKIATSFRGLFWVERRRRTKTHASIHGYSGYLSNNNKSGIVHDIQRTTTTHTKNNAIKSAHRRSPNHVSKSENGKTTVRGALCNCLTPPAPQHFRYNAAVGCCATARKSRGALNGIPPYIPPRGILDYHCSGAGRRMLRVP